LWLALVAGSLPAAALLYPNHLSLATQQAQLQAVYSQWKADLVTTTGTGCSGCYRVQRPNDKGLEVNSTVSEGMGYGLVIAAYMGDQALFNGLWKYTANWLDGNGLMNWYINAAGTGLGSNPSGSGAAPDADEDVIWGLILAHYKWGDAGAYNYQALATTMLNNFMANEVQGTTVKDGDGWGGTGGPFNSSYFDPASYKVFGQFSGNSAWNSVADTSYTDINLSINSANGNLLNGLVPAWHDTGGAPVLPFAPSGTERANWYAYYQYDACRTPFRLAKDYIFFGDARAKAYLDKVNSFFPPIGAANVVDGYTTHGVAAPEMPTLTVSQYAYSQSAPFIGPAGVAAMAGSNQQFVNDAWDQMYSVASGGCMVGGQYYAESWAVLCMLMMTGQFTDPMPTPTPTPTPNPCAVAFRINAGGGPAVGAFAADQPYASGSFGYVSWAAGTPSSSAGPVSTGSNSAPAQVYLTERYCYQCAVGYEFDVPPGTYAVTFHWAETYYGTGGNRSVAASINGAGAVPSTDLFTAAGGQNKAYDVTVSNVSPVNGHILINITSSNNSATIHGIEVVGLQACTPSRTPSFTPNWTATPTATITQTPSASPSFSASPTFSASATISPTFTAFPTPDACTVVRRVDCASASAFTDSSSQVWAADQAYAAGSYGYVSWAAGTAASSAGPISGTPDGALYMTERYGSTVGYRFTLPNGAYRVRLRFAETLHTAPGQRVMSWSAQGSAVIGNLDVYSASGGKNVALDLTFSASVSAGVLDLLGWASVDNATVMGIEVIGDAGCTPTRTLTFTPGAPSATPTATPSRSPTLTPSATPSGTPSRSPSATVSATPSQSPSPTATDTPAATVSLSASATGTPASGSATPSPTAVPSRTVSPPATATMSPSESSTPTRSISPSLTLTASPSMTIAVPPSASPSATPSVTPPPPGSSPTSSPTLSPSSSPSLTATRTASVTPPSTFTRTATGTASPTLSPNPTASVSETSTFSPTATRSVTVAITPTPTATGSASSVAASATVTPIWTATATGGGDPVISSAVFMPSAWNGQGMLRVAMLLKGPADQVRWKLYSTALVCVRQGTLGAQARGWDYAPMDLEASGLAKGLYYLVLTAEGAGKTNVCKAKLKLMLLS
jgi:hypothetical protein